MTRRRRSIPLGVVLSVWLLLTGATFGEYSIRISGVPERLEFPSREGSNRVLTATVRGGPVRSAWLARSRDSTRRVELTRVDDAEFQINLDGSEVLDSLATTDSEHRFQVFAEMSDGTIVISIAVHYVLRFAPRGLEFPWGRATITLLQRESKDLPGSQGYWRLRLGDVTNGQVLLSVLDAQNKPVVDTMSVKAGDAIPITLGGEEFVLVVDNLVNLIVGDDYGVFTIISAKVWEKSRIVWLLMLVEDADATFIRNGQELTPKEFAEHLRRKRDHFAPQLTDTDQFIESLASRSMHSGQPYLVKVNDAQPVETGEWLRTLAATGKLNKP